MRDSRLAESDRVFRARATYPNSSVGLSFADRSRLSSNARNPLSRSLRATFRRRYRGIAASALRDRFPAITSRNQLRSARTCSSAGLLRRRSHELGEVQFESAARRAHCKHHGARNASRRLFARGVSVISAPRGWMKRERRSDGSGSGADRRHDSPRLAPLSAL